MFDDVVSRLGEIRRHGQGRQVALRQRLGDLVAPVLAGIQKFVVPDRDVPAEGDAVDQPHQILGVLAVLLAVAQEYLGVKGRPHPFCQLVANQDGREYLLQLFGIGNLRGVGGRTVKELDVPIAGLDAVQAFDDLLIVMTPPKRGHDRRAGGKPQIIPGPIQTTLHEDGDDGDVVLHGEAVLHELGAALAEQEPRCDGNHEELHLREQPLQFLRVGRRVPFGLVVDGAVLGLENVPAEGLEMQLEVVGVAGEVHAGFPLGGSISFGLNSKF